MPESQVISFGQPMKVACDGNCQKAWGVSCRPKKQLSEDPDDYYYLFDGELDNAPTDPGTAEGGEIKPLSALYFPNKWCVRECERCYYSKLGEYRLPARLPNFFAHFYNQPWKHGFDQG